MTRTRRVTSCDARSISPRSPARRPKSVFTLSMLADIERQLGGAELARAMSDTALARLEAMPPAHPAMAHVRAITLALAARLRLDDDVAREPHVARRCVRGGGDDARRADRCDGRRSRRRRAARRRPARSVGRGARRGRRAARCRRPAARSRSPGSPAQLRTELGERRVRRRVRARQGPRPGRRTEAARPDRGPDSD